MKRAGEETGQVTEFTDPRNILIYSVAMVTVISCTCLCNCVGGCNLQYKGVKGQQQIIKTSCRNRMRS